MLGDYLKDQRINKEKYKNYNLRIFAFKYYE